MTSFYKGTVGRGFTAWYGRFMDRIDAAGLGDLRCRVLSQAHGRVLDVGTGTGANLGLFPAAVEELILTEPSPHMRRALRRRLGQQACASIQLSSAPAEDLPFEDATFDFVTCTMVICTLPDPRTGLAEVARVLKPGGQLLFLEHVRSNQRRTAFAQDRLERPWRFVADGCHCNRESLALIQTSPLTLKCVERAEMPLAPGFMRPLVFGSAAVSS